MIRSLERGARRTLSAIDAAGTRAYGSAWNPVHQSGTVAVAMLLVLLVTGLYLVLFYRLGSPWQSVSRMAADPWLGSWMRSLHRYATDVFLIAAALHMLRMFAQARGWGPRALAWVSGLFLVATGLVCAWTGFVMAWDTFGERLARDGARLLDVLPILSEPISRIFAGDGPVPSAFFFVNMFIHLAVPLAMGGLLWVHVSRVARPMLLPPRRVMWGIIGVLTLASIALPAPLGNAANPFRLPEQTPIDLVVAWWLPLSERLSPWMSWALMIFPMLALVTLAWWTRRPREGRWAPSVVDPRYCVGCDQCPQDCPWEAITMVKRDDDRPTLLAQVDPARCVSCGICAGSCAPMGIGPPGRDGRDQLAVIREELLPRLKTTEHALVAVCCERAPAAQLSLLRDRGALVHSINCVGNLHTSVVEVLLRAGARGVVIGSCPPRDCANREGPKWLHERLYNEREAELQERVDRRRLRVITMAPGTRADARAALHEFLRELDALDQPAAESSLDVDPACEVPALAEKSP